MEDTFENLLARLELGESADFTGISFEGKNLWLLDFSNATGLSWEQIAEADNFSGIRVPEGIDFTGVSFKGKDIDYVKFGNATGLTREQIEEAENFQKATLPSYL